MVGMDASGAENTTLLQEIPLPGQHQAPVWAVLGDVTQCIAFIGCRICAVINIFSIASHSSLLMNSPAFSSSAFNSVLLKKIHFK